MPHFVEMTFGDGKQMKVNDDHDDTWQKEGDKGGRYGVDRAKVNLALRLQYSFMH